MTSLESQTTVGEPHALTHTAGSSPRWWAAVAAGAAVSLPLGWLLSYGAALPFFLGLFFFILFGLLIGAVVFRVGLHARPVPSTRLKIGAAVVVIVCWGLSMGIEVYQFPTDQGAAALTKIAPLPDGMNAESMKAHVAEFVRNTLRREYGSAGFVGYARWIIASSRMEFTVETMTKPVILQPSQHRWWWAVRVLLCIVLLTFGVYTQLIPLTQSPVASAGRPEVTPT